MKGGLKETRALREALIHICALLIAGCAGTSSGGLETCGPTSTYVGPTLRAAITSDTLPSTTINTERSVSPELASRLDDLFAQLIENQTAASRASIAVWSTRSGFWSADFGAEPNAGSGSFWWASVGKLITASVVLQLVDEDKVSLDDPLSDWFPDYPNAELITVDHLLTHTGGVFSFNYDLQLQKRDGYKPIDLLIDVSASHGADFCPGTNWNYSNTGYVMLGRIAEIIERKSLADIVEARMARPQALHSLAVVTPTDDASAIVSPIGETPPDTAAIASIYGAGAIKGTATDMLHVLAGYFRADSVSPEMRDLAFSDLYPMFGSTIYYGRGVMATDVPDPSQPTVWIGHSGGSPNAKAVVIYDVEREVFLALVLNIQAPAEAIANAVLKEFDNAHQGSNSVADRPSSAGIAMPSVYDE